MTMSAASALRIADGQASLHACLFPLFLSKCVLSICIVLYSLVYTQILHIRWQSIAL